MGRIQTQVDLGTMLLPDTPQDKTGPQRFLSQKIMDKDLIGITLIITHLLTNRFMVG